MTIIDELTAVDRAVGRGTERLFELQHPDGHWVDELESNVTMTAQHLFWHHFLGLRTPELDRRIANELLARMRDDGTWSIWFEGPADLSTSIEAYVALRPGVQRPGVETQRENVVRAGTWTDTGWPATMESAVRSGRAAAQRILKHGLVRS